MPCCECAPVQQTAARWHAWHLALHHALAIAWHLALHHALAQLLRKMLAAYKWSTAFGAGLAACQHSLCRGAHHLPQPLLQPFDCRRVTLTRGTTVSMELYQRHELRKVRPHRCRCTLSPARRILVCVPRRPREIPSVVGVVSRTRFPLTLTTARE